MVLPLTERGFTMAKTTRSIGLNPNKFPDLVVMQWLDRQENKSDYIKRLVMQDIRKQQGYHLGENNVLKPKLFAGVVS
jgi:transcription initiation factor IIF auxiliary subunit